MTKQEQIEEMAKIYCKNEFLCSKGCQTNGCRVYEVSEAIYNAGYRKIDDKCAVITKDDLKLYQKQAVKEFVEKLKERLCKECSGCYIPNCFESPTDEFAYNAKEVEKIIDELLKDYLK